MSTDDESPEEITLEDLQRQINVMRGSIYTCNLNNNKLKKKIYDLTIENSNLFDYINHVEIKVIEQDQYSRRSNVELKNVPESVKQSVTWKIMC